MATRTRPPPLTATAPTLDPERMRAHAGEAAQLLKALSNPHRLLLLCLLVEGERSVSELNAHLALSQPALSQHLALLREEGLVRTHREAQRMVYSLADGPARRIIRALHAIYCGTGR